MSLPALRYWAERVTAPSPLKAVGFAIAWRADDDGVAWPSLATIGREAGMSPRHARRVVDHLVAHGAVLRQQRRGQSARYRMPVDGQAVTVPALRRLAGEEPGTPWAAVTEDTVVLTTQDTVVPGAHRAFEGDPGHGGHTTEDTVVTPPRTTVSPELKGTTSEPSGTPSRPASTAVELVAVAAVDVVDEERASQRELFGAVAGACYPDERLTRSARDRVGQAVGELLEVGATVDDVVWRAGVYRRKWPSIDLTPQALVKHWSSLATAPGDAGRLAIIAAVAKVEAAGGFR